ncbi:hypothetical protein DM860_006529 [Cuscuta australis]|uniref:Peroxidase n=1 Tax=Cuscuta australis TaxID=267555 RepID=A0A328D7Z0_9ASTE|nr:hypothetical protein DM860_006529 [Cuscuta australis]
MTNLLSSLLVIMVMVISSGAHPGGLSPFFYDFSCPHATDIVSSVLERAILEDPRVAASLLRLHFHDCFVQGCDASILLDKTPTMASEKDAGPNKNSVRGFDVIDEMKAKVEQVCPHTVSCADILAIAARDSVLMSGGPYWEVALGRRDSKTASFKQANTNIPPPNSTVQNLLSLFSRQGLDEQDLVALSGGHTIGVARCVTFRQRLYNQFNDAPLEKAYYNNLKVSCPPSGGDNNISPLDVASPLRFDNTYFRLLLSRKELLISDEALLAGNVGRMVELVKAYADNEALFFHHFAGSMRKMGNINPLVGLEGEIRHNCHRVN